MNGENITGDVNQKLDQDSREMYSKSPDIDQQFSNAGEAPSKLFGGITEEINYPKKLASSIQMTSSAEPFLTFYYPIKNL